MERGDEIWLPDGRVVPYRRGTGETASAPRGRPGSAVRAVPGRGRDRRRNPRSDDDRGRGLDLKA